MNFTDNEFDAFERDLKEATAELCKKYKIKLKESKISYGPVEFDMKLTFQKNEEGLNADAINFSMECFRYGFKPSDYMRTFEHLGAMYKFVGFDTSARKYNCLIREVETGITSRVNHKMLTEMLKRDEARLASEEKKEDISNLPAITDEELSRLQIKLGKNKLNGKDLEQIFAMLSGKIVYTFKPNQISAFVGIHRQIAEEEEQLSVFTSVESCKKHLNELGRLGLVSGDIAVSLVAFDDVIRLSDLEKMDVVIDNTELADQKYMIYSHKTKKMEVVSKPTTVGQG